MQAILGDGSTSMPERDDIKIMVAIASKGDPLRYNAFMQMTRYEFHIVYITELAQYGD